MVVFVAWVDDVMVLGPPSLVEQVQRDLEKSFTCKRKGELTEYVGSKLTFSHDELERELSSSHNLQACFLNAQATYVNQYSHNAISLHLKCVIMKQRLANLSFHTRREKIIPFTHTPVNFFLTRFFTTGCATGFFPLVFFSMGTSKL